MSRQCVPVRNEKRKSSVARFAAKRAELKAIISSEKATYEEKIEARDALNKLPKDSSRVRLRKRCSITGRGRGVFAIAGICRNKLRQMAANGELPGIQKSSW
jgi:small subunit ribosomal protein S14